MSDTHTDLVIQISTSGPEPETARASIPEAQDNRLIQELRRCLQPGVEIALVFESYMAITSILWLSDLQADGSVRAGVRLLGVSAIGDRSKPLAWSETPQRAPSTSLQTIALSHSV